MRMPMQMLVLLLLVSGPAAAGTEALVVGLRSATVLELGDGGQVRLAGVHVPPAHEAAARALIEERIRPPARVAIEAGDGGRDRHGRLPALVTGPDGAWLQERLLAAGLALVAGEAGVPARTARLLELEHRARAAGRGLWGRADAPLFAAEGPAPPVGRFAIVRGRVREAGGSRSYLYLNFGEDWRRDFTLRLRRQELEEVLGRSDAEWLVGRLVEARGVVMAAGGPLIELSRAEQIEVVE